MSSIEQFIAQAWDDHVDDLAGVVARLPQAQPLLREAPQRLDDYLQLAAHVHLDHRGDAAAMQAVLDDTAALRTTDAAAQTTADKARLAMALLRGEPAPTLALSWPARVRAHGQAASGLAARGDIAGARRVLQAGAALARDAAPELRTDATKALAASANNLASQLLHEARRADADALMLEAAALARTNWEQAGTWLHVERAEYLLALAHAAVGDGARALAHARACASGCEANNADAFERLFAHEALARALRANGERAAAEDEAARMQALLPEVPEDSRAYATSTLERLRQAL